MTRTQDRILASLICAALLAAGAVLTGCTRDDHVAASTPESAVTAPTASEAAADMPEVVIVASRSEPNAGMR